MASKVDILNFVRPTRKSWYLVSLLSLPEIRFPLEWSSTQRQWLCPEERGEKERKILFKGYIVGPYEMISYEEAMDARKPFTEYIYLTEAFWSYQTFFQKNSKNYLQLSLPVVQ